MRIIPVSILISVKIKGSAYYRKMLVIFTRSVVNKNGDLLFLTSKKFDILYFLYLHKGQGL